MAIWTDVHIAELGVLCMIKVIWAFAAALTPGSRWRLLVAAQMSSGSAFFWLLFWILLTSRQPSMTAGPVTEIVLALYAATTLAAFLGWLRLPAEPRRS